LVAEAELNLRPSGLNRGIPLFVEHCKAVAGEIDIRRHWLGEYERRVLNLDVDELRWRPLIGIEEEVVARVFFVWVRVFNLSAAAVFLSFMADLFTAEQGKRLFDFIGAGSTAGALFGPVITNWAVGTARLGQPANRGAYTPRRGRVLRPSG
jgi:hypothetical protein